MMLLTLRNAAQTIIASEAKQSGALALLKLPDCRFASRLAMTAP